MFCNKPLHVFFEKRYLSVRSEEMSDSATYEYTPEGWLKKITFTNGTVIEITYDDMGNRVSVVTTCSGSGC